MNPVHTPAQHLARLCGPAAGALVQAGVTGMLLEQSGIQTHGVLALSVLLTITVVLLLDLPWWRSEYARRKVLRPLCRDLELLFRHSRYSGYRFHPGDLSVTLPGNLRASPLHLRDGWVYVAAPQRAPRVLVKLEGAAPNPQAEHQLQERFGPTPPPTSLN